MGGGGPKKLRLKDVFRPEKKIRQVHRSAPRESDGSAYRAQRRKSRDAIGCFKTIYKEINGRGREVLGRLRQILPDICKDVEGLKKNVLRKALNMVSPDYSVTVQACVTKRGAVPLAVARIQGKKGGRRGKRLGREIFGLLKMLNAPSH